VRKIIIIAALLLSGVAWAQGTFTAVLDSRQALRPHESPFKADAAIRLEAGSFLAINMVQHGPFFIDRGAFLERQSGERLFEFGKPIFAVPDAMLWDSGFTLSQSSLDDLHNGRLYLSIASVDFPDGEIRGQILLVPEPSACALAVMAAIGLLPFYPRKLFRRGLD
jgi:hypothetical protein